MRRLTYRIPLQWEGKPVKAYARGCLELSAKAFAGQKFENGMFLNEQPCRANTILHSGDSLCFFLPEEPAGYPAVPLPLDILWETEDYLLALKPPAMPVHPSPGHDRDSLLNAVAWHNQVTNQAYRVRPLYRLDKDTSGLLPLAKHRIAAGARLEKRYLALCQGKLDGSGVVDIPIGLAPGSKIRRECGRGQPAITHWQALAGDGFHTLLALRLETGRTHQIRVHMAYIGHPLAGDDLYGGSLAVVSRQALHCCSLRLECPALGVAQEFYTPLPQDLLSAFPWAEIPPQPMEKLGKAI